MAATNEIIQDEAITDDLLNERTFGWNTTDPTSDAPEWFINTTDNKLKRNTGTPASPVYVDELTLEDGGIVWVI